MSAAAVIAIAVLGIVTMFAASWFLSRTMLRGEATSFSLELPPYRPPRVVSLAQHAVSSLDPIGLLIGLNGVILLAYIVAIPANEIVIPTVLMLTVLTVDLAGAGSGAGVMFELESIAATGEILRAGGWTLLTGINLMLFSLLHNPCSTTLYTIYRETRSAGWTTLAAVLPVAIGVTVCFLVTQIWRLVATA